MITTLLLALTAGATEPEPSLALIEALQEELNRSVEELNLPDAPPLYHLRYHLLHLQPISMVSAWGSLRSEQSRPRNMLGVEVRVGSPAFDSTGLAGWQNGFDTEELPQRLTETALRADAWRLTDRSYKQALEQYSRKDAQHTPPPDHPGDYTLTGAVQADGGPGAPPTPEALRTLTHTLSAAFLGGDRVLDRGEVHLDQQGGWLWTLDSEGSSVRRPVQHTTLRAIAHLRAEDGSRLVDQRLWTVKDPSALPDAEAMREEVVQMRDQLQALVSQPSLDGEYVGPVLFEEEAAADLFRYLLLPQLEGTPPVIPFESWFGSIANRKDLVRVSRRVLPMGWDVTDDPTRLPDHPGAFSHDMEGTPATSVHAVEDGIVRALLMSRTPRKGLEETTGHGRGQLGHRAEGRASLTEVLPDRRVSSSRLRKRALRVAKSYGRDWVIVIQRLQDPAAMQLGQGSVLVSSESRGSAMLPSPVSVIRLYADGREEVVRGVQFADVERWVLRDILAAGPQAEVDYMAPPRSYHWMRPTSGFPAWISAPHVLIGEMELLPESGSPSSIPVLPPPEPPG